MQRRSFMGAGAAALGTLSASSGAGAYAEGRAFAASPSVAPIRASADRLIDISVCTRPFRAQGPRIETEQRFGKTIVHHYGHGGSGVTLAWGCAEEVVALLRTDPTSS